MAIALEIALWNADLVPGRNWDRRQQRVLGPHILADMLDEHGRAVTTVGKTAGSRDRIDHIETTPVLEFARMSDLSHHEVWSEIRYVDGDLWILEIPTLVSARDISLQLCRCPPCRPD